QQQNRGNQQENQVAAFIYLFAVSQGSANQNQRIHAHDAQQSGKQQSALVPGSTAGDGRRVADPPQTEQSATQNDHGHDKSNAKSNALGTQNHDAVISRQSVGELEIPLDDFGQVGKKLG